MAARARQRRQLPLPPQLASGTFRNRRVGSTSRPVFEGIESGDGLNLAVVELGGGPDAERSGRPEDRDQGHRGLGELEGMAPGKATDRASIVKASSGRGPIRLDGSDGVRPRTRSPRRAKPSRAHPASGLLSPRAKWKKSPNASADWNKGPPGRFRVLAHFTPMKE